jgi:hypothetical protein
MHERNPWVKKRDVKKASGSVGKTDGAEREFEAANVIEPETTGELAECVNYNLAVLDVTVNKSSELGFR